MASVTRKYRTASLEAMSQVMPDGYVPLSEFPTLEFTFPEVPSSQRLTEELPLVLLQDPAVNRPSVGWLVVLVLMVGTCLALGLGGRWVDARLSCDASVEDCQ